jgi:hypothetical protein
MPDPTGDGQICEAREKPGAAHRRRFEILSDNTENGTTGVYRGRNIGAQHDGEQHWSSPTIAARYVQLANRAGELAVARVAVHSIITVGRPRKRKPGPQARDTNWCAVAKREADAEPFSTRWTIPLPRRRRCRTRCVNLAVVANVGDHARRRNDIDAAAEVFDT